MFLKPPLFPVPSRFKSTKIKSTMETPNNSKKRVLVCGGGVIGVCTAYFLSKKGAAVTIIEQSSIACAASGKAGGFLALDWCDGGPVSSLARASFNLHRQLAHELNGPESYGYRPLNTLSLTVTEEKKSTNSAAEKSTSSAGKSTNSAENEKSRIPAWVDGPAKGARTIGTRETTAQVHPGMFTRKLVEVMVGEYGVEVVIGKVESVERGRVGLEGGGVVEGDAVVVAMGPWTGRFGLVSSVVKVHGVKAHSVVLEPKEEGVISAHALFLSYYSAPGGPPMDPEIYPRPTGEVYICGMSSPEEVPDDPEQIEPNPDSIRVLKRVAGTVSSHLGEEESRVKAEQACFLPCTDDSIPVIGEIPGMKDCYVATGHSCWGILNGPATGAAMAELVMDGRSTIVDLSRFSPDRFVGRRRK